MTVVLVAVPAVCGCDAFQPHPHCVLVLPCSLHVFFAFLLVLVCFALHVLRLLADGPCV